MVINSFFQTGNFTLTIFFHSFTNPKHLCGECREEMFGPVCCDTYQQMHDCFYICGIRMITSVEAFSSPALDITISEEVNTRYYSDNIPSFPEGHEIFPHVSNPYVVLLTTWTVSFLNVDCYYFSKTAWFIHLP